MARPAVRRSWCSRLVHPQKAGPIFRAGLFDEVAAPGGKAAACKRAWRDVSGETARFTLHAVLGQPLTS
jgi:hypothetical protein